MDEQMTTEQPIAANTDKRMQWALRWAPRVLGILFATFISLFALDVFSEGYSFWETVLSLLMHLIPTGILLVVLALSWRWEWVGGILFSALGILYLIAARGAYPVIWVPLFLEGALFVMSWRYSSVHGDNA
jgi:hypothetical protein